MSAVGATVSTSPSESASEVPRSAEFSEASMWVSCRKASMSFSAFEVIDGSNVSVAWAPDISKKSGLVLHSSSSVISGAGSAETVGIMPSKIDSSSSRS